MKAVEEIILENGTVCQHLCRPWENIWLWHNDVRTDFMKASDDELRGIWINYCIEGCCELLVENEGYFYLDEGQICVGPNKAADSFRYPRGKYAGVELFISEQDSGGILKMISDLGFSVMGIKKNIAGKPAFHLQQLLDMTADELIHEKGSLEDYRMKTLQILYMIGKNEILPFENNSYLTKGQRQIALRAADELKAHPEKEITMKSLAFQFDVNPSTFKRCFEIAMGENFTAYRQRIRCEKAAVLLKTTKMPVGDISEAVGYSHQGKFGALFKRLYGCSPLDYRRLNTSF